MAEAGNGNRRNPARYLTALNSIPDLPLAGLKREKRKVQWTFRRAETKFAPANFGWGLLTGGRKSLLRFVQDVVGYATGIREDCFIPDSDNDEAAGLKIFIA